MGRYRSIRKLYQNVRSIEGKGFYFGFYLHLKIKSKVGIIVSIGNDDFFLVITKARFPKLFWLRNTMSYHLSLRNTFC